VADQPAFSAGEDPGGAVVSDGHSGVRIAAADFALDGIETASFLQNRLPV